jgi:hypothetical protein
MFFIAHLVFYVFFRYELQINWYQSLDPSHFLLSHKIQKRGHPTIFFSQSQTSFSGLPVRPPQGFQYIHFSPFSTCPLQGTRCLLRALRSSMILSATSIDRLASVVHENYVTMKRAIYRGFCIHCHNSNSGFNNGSPGATPSATTQSSNTHATRYTLPITEVCGPNEW